MSSLSKNRFLARFFGGAIGITLLGSAVIELSSPAWSFPKGWLKGSGEMVIHETAERRLQATFPDTIRAKNGWARIKITCKMSPRIEYGPAPRPDGSGGGSQHSLLVGTSQYYVYSGDVIDVPCTGSTCVYPVRIDGREVEDPLTIQAY